MRQFVLFLTLQLALLGTVLCAAFEIADDDMRDIEDTFKSLDSNVTLKDTKAAAEAAELVAYFKTVEGFYAQKPETADGAGFARKTHEAAALVVQSVSAGHYDEALEAVQQINKTCKRCHDVYKQK